MTIISINNKDERLRRSWRMCWPDYKSHSFDYLLNRHEKDKARSKLNNNEEVAKFKVFFFFFFEWWVLTHTIGALLPMLTDVSDKARKV